MISFHGPKALGLQGLCRSHSTTAMSRYTCPMRPVRHRLGPSAPRAASNNPGPSESPKPAAANKPSKTSGSSSSQLSPAAQQASAPPAAGASVPSSPPEASAAAIDAAEAASDAMESAATAAADAVQSASKAASDAADSLAAAASQAPNNAADTASEMVFAAADMASDMANGNAMSATNGSSSSSTAARSNMYQPPPLGRISPAIKTMEADEEEVQALQLKLLAAVSSLDRGLAANVKEAQEVDELATQLEQLEGAVTLDWKTSRSSPDTSPMDRLSGTWRLIYSSGFNNGSLGGSRPGPPAAFVPLILGQVYQVIDGQQGRLDNVVELLSGLTLPRLPFLPPPKPEMMPGVRVTLGHSCEVVGASDVRIVYDATAAKVIGPELLENLPRLQVPDVPEFLRPPADLRAATFSVTFLDDMMRITRGDRGELRVYLKDTALEPVVPADYVD